MVIELKYSNTNTYLIKGAKDYVLFDTGWAGSFNAFCKEIGYNHVSIDEIKYIIISHYHPDHMGIAQEIANYGSKIIILNFQKDFVHFADGIFAKEGRDNYVAIDDESAILVDEVEGKELLSQIGVNCDIFHTPGHSDDSISLLLNSGELFVGDLNPLYELELHRGTEIYDSWSRLLANNPTTVYYGHAKTAELNCGGESNENHKISEDTSKSYADVSTNAELYRLVKNIMKLIDKGKNIDVICNKTGADKVFIEDVMRMYLTHQNVGVQGILDRIEIKGK